MRYGATRLVAFSTMHIQRADPVVVLVLPRTNMKGLLHLRGGSRACAFLITEMKAKLPTQCIPALTIQVIAVMGTDGFGAFTAGESVRDLWSSMFRGCGHFPAASLHFRTLLEARGMTAHDCIAISDACCGRVLRLSASVCRRVNISEAEIGILRSESSVSLTSRYSAADIP